VILAPAGDSEEAARLADEIGARWAVVDGPTSIVGALAQVLHR
jgi:hypothetical protein